MKTQFLYQPNLLKMNLGTKQIKVGIIAAPVSERRECMMTLKKLNLIFLLYFPLILTSIEASADRKNVCTITINSSDEADTFKKFLSDKEFNFIELTQKDNDQWLANACKQKIHCDMLIISGHFGGSFFGSSNILLPMEDLEANSCNSECDGIFKQPKEVFLFGCNTLAGKDKDARLPEQYREILLQDGFSIQQAEQIVAFRYSPIGQSFNDRMKRIFSGVRQIFGFDSIAPSGMNAKPMLINYLKNNGLQYVQKLGVHNDILSFFKKTSMIMTAGEKVQTSMTPACYFNDKNISAENKLVTVDSIVRGQNTKFFLENVAHIEHFIKSLPKDKLSPAEMKAYIRLSQPSANKQIVQYLIDTQMNGLPTVQINLLNLAQDFEWIDSKGYDEKINNITNIKSILRSRISLEDRDFLCSLQIKINLTLSEIPEERWHGDDGKRLIYLIGCLRPKDINIQRKLATIIMDNELLTPTRAGGRADFLRHKLHKN